MFENIPISWFVIIAWVQNMLKAIKTKVQIELFILHNYITKISIQYYKKKNLSIAAYKMIMIV